MASIAPGTSGRAARSAGAASRTQARERRTSEGQARCSSRARASRRVNDDGAVAGDVVERPAREQVDVHRAARCSQQRRERRGREEAAEAAVAAAVEDRRARSTPGHSTLTRSPRGAPSSRRRARRGRGRRSWSRRRARPSATGRKAAIEAVLTTWPKRWATRRGQAACTPCTTPIRLTSTASRQSSSRRSASVAADGDPGVVEQIVEPVVALRTRRPRARETAAASRTSRPAASARPPFAADLRTASASRVGRRRGRRGPRRARVGRARGRAPHRSGGPAVTRATAPSNARSASAAARGTTRRARRSRAAPSRDRAAASPPSREVHHHVPRGGERRPLRTALAVRVAASGRTRPSTRSPAPRAPRPRPWSPRRTSRAPSRTRTGSRSRAARLVVARSDEATYEKR